MSKVSPAVRRESLRVGLWIAGLSLLMQLTFLLLGRWDATVVWGNLLGACAAWANFFLMGLTVQKALGMEEKNRANLVRLSQTLRLLMQGGALVLDFTLSCFHPLAAVLPLFFPQLPIRLRPIVDRKKDMTGGDGQ